MSIEPENRPSRTDDPWLRVPASARPADRHRFSPDGGDEMPAEIDDNDEDVEFLKAIAEEAAVESRPRPVVVPRVPARRFNVPADANLELFRTTEVERPRPRVLRQMEVDLVEMDDLLEQLSTTAAALRRRKAA